ncbi:MAG TPA: cysteine--1-D-myo-inosityl 2-amino-2-deoxy-alpha-D-glucopyranoside ligase [Streptosporangiaceae bacterium]|jgi:L-cysteine:1D-myo-inositol 2-amino-2-deoxy-alpha-D-glucopyranoside ligase
MESWRGVPVPELPGTGPEPRIRDTATGELLVAADGHVATMYACGITPYDSTHIGHAATFTAWDLLLRAWLDAGHEVIYVQNVTDVDDPLLERAARDGADWRQLADREIDRYRADMHALRVLPPSRLVGAVEAMSLIERFTARLADCGALYELDADLYFPRSADPLFGSLSRLSPRVMVKLFAERGGDPGRPGKKDPLDPLVWLAARPGEPSWASPFGDGRPGWHVECAAISTEYLGTVFDMQVGGTDLIFPHHEMSASHARAAFGGGGAAAFARRYAHAGMVGLDGEKMSKSLGNLVFVSDLVADGTEPAAIRLALLAHHYRDDWDWTAAGLAAAEERLARWRSAVAAADRSATVADPGAAGTDRSVAGADRSVAGTDRSVAGTDRGVAGGDPGAAGAADPSDSPARRALASVRDRLADDLDAPGALAAVDQWAEAVLAGSATGGGRLIRDAVDALLGVEL